MKMMMELILCQFSLHACPEQVPPTTKEQPKRGRGQPHKPNPPDSGDKPKHTRGRLPKHKYPPLNSSSPEPKKPKLDHIPTQSQITAYNAINSLLVQQLRGSTLSLLGGNSPLSALMTLHSKTELQCMMSLITSNAAAFDKIINHLLVQYATFHLNLVPDRGVPNLSLPLLLPLRATGNGNC